MSPVFPVTPDARFRLYTATEGQTAFSVPFPWQNNGDITVWRIDLEGDRFVLNEAEHYNLTGAGTPAGGTMELTEGHEALAGEQFLVIGDADLTRISSIVADGRFRSRLSDDEFDRQILIAQEIYRELGRTLRTAYGTYGAEVEIGADNELAVWIDGRLVPGPVWGDEIGIPGQGIPTGGAASRLLRKASSADYDTEWWSPVASAIGFTPAGGLAATTVQAALEELDSEKAVAATTREKLTAARTYYVRSDGSNSNDGLTDSSGGAFLTIAKAMSVVSTIDFNGYTVTVQVRDGTFAGFTVPVTVGQAGVANLVIQGNSSTPANVAITSAMTIGAGARATIKDLAVTSAGHGLVADGAGAVVAFSNISFGACTNAQIYVANCATATMTGNCSFTGASQTRVWARWNAAYVEEFRTCTYTSTPSYSVANMYILSGATVSAAVSTQSGSATGVRYVVSGNALLETGGGGASFFPGDSSGSTSTGGQYT